MVPPSANTSKSTLIQHKQERPHPAQARRATKRSHAVHPPTCAPIRQVCKGVVALTVRPAMLCLLHLLGLLAICCCCSHQLGRCSPLLLPLQCSCCGGSRICRCTAPAICCCRLAALAALAALLSLLPHLPPPLLLALGRPNQGAESSKGGRQAHTTLRQVPNVPLAHLRRKQAGSRASGSAPTKKQLRGLLS